MASSSPARRRRRDRDRRGCSVCGRRSRNARDGPCSRGLGRKVAPTASSTARASRRSRGPSLRGTRRRETRTRPPSRTRTSSRCGSHAKPRRSTTCAASSSPRDRPVTWATSKAGPTSRSGRASAGGMASVRNEPNTASTAHSITCGNAPLPPMRSRASASCSIAAGSPSSTRAASAARHLHDVLVARARRNHDAAREGPAALDGGRGGPARHRASPARGAVAVGLDRPLPADGAAGARGDHDLRDVDQRPAVGLAEAVLGRRGRAACGAAFQWKLWMLRHPRGAARGAHSSRVAVSCRGCRWGPRSRACGS